MITNQLRASKMSLAHRKSILYQVACCSLLVATLWGGWREGHASHRWGDSQELQRAAEQLGKPLAVRFGNWRLQSEQPFSADVVRLLQCPAHICRTYVNEQTGDNVNVAVIVGPAGPVSVHTPEICYSSEDFQVTSRRAVTQLRDRSGRQHSLWDLKLQANGLHASSLRVLYGWGTGGAWSATDSPRFQHAGKPYLYKIQLAAAASEATDEYDPCQDFLEAFLSELSSRLVPQEASSQPLAHTPSS
jgi:hypothetical protein